MANSTITLYTREIGIEAEKLQMIEDFEAYLQSKATSLAIVETYQYQKIELNKYLKVDISQSYQSPLKDKNYIYCKIVNSDNTTRPLYYWIKKMNWKSQSCIELELVLDTLNTFKMGVDYTFSPKTIIQRQHKDRLEYKSSGDLLDLRSTTITEEHPIIEGTYYRPYTIDLRESIFMRDLYFTDSNGENCDWKMSIFKADGSPIIFEWLVGLIECKEMYGNYRAKTIRIWKSDSSTYKDITFEENDNSTIITFAVLENESGNFINDDEDETEQFKNQIYQYNNSNATTFISRKIDFISEELNPTLYGEKTTDSNLVQDVASHNRSWYLVYNTANDTAVECYLVPESPLEVKVSTLSLTGGVIHAENLQSGYTHILLDNITEVGGGDVYFNGVSYGASNFKKADGSDIPTLSGEENCILELSKSGNKILGSVIVFQTDSNGNYKEVKQGLSFITDYIQYVGAETSIQYNYNSTSLDLGNAKLSDLSTTLTFGYTYSARATRILGGIASLNKTTSTLLKIIKLPYVPYDFSVDSSDRIIIDTSFDFVSSWNGISNVLKLVNLNVDLKRTISTPTTQRILSPIYSRMKIEDSLLVFNSNRNDFLESKMFHSEFFMAKATYDSFTFPYKLELVDMNEWLDYVSWSIKYLDIDFIMTRTMNSRFAFKFNDYLVGDKREQDYYNWLLIGRNNEEVIYNTAYLNYIRTGYQYDVKNKEQQNAKNWIFAGASLLGTGLAVVGAVASGGATLPLAIAGISGVIASATTLTGAITSQAQNERSLQEKLDTLKIQSASVSGSDDVDLMTRYNGNRLLRIDYKVNERVDKLLKDLFYYYGYKDNISGIPSTNTRVWFNYLKCEPILEFTSLNITNDIEDELKGIMRNGFTICHKYNGEWNLEQNKENWEVSMLPYLS